MRAIEVTQPGGPQVLTITDTAQPQPGPGEVLVQVRYAGVNFIDIYRRQGVYPAPLPAIPGSEGSGVVAQLGPDVAQQHADIHEGMRVAWAASVTGSYAEYAVVRADQLLPVPDTVSDTVAAALPLQGMTAHYLVTSCYILHHGHEALIHAGAGGVGQLATQLAVRAGARVLATVGAPDKEEIAHQAGADVVIRYDQLADLATDLPAAVRAATDGAGVHVVYDGVGKSTFEASLACLRRRGLLVLFGGASGQVPPFDLQRLNALGSLYVTRPTLSDYTASRSELLWRADDLFDAAASGALRVPIWDTYALPDAAASHAALESRATHGKLLLAL